MDTEFITAQGFLTVLKLVLNYQQLCIYWTKYYTLEDPFIKRYVMAQLGKPRYSSPAWVSSPHKRAPEYSCSTLEMEEVRGLLTDY